MHILFLSDNFPPEVNAPASRTYEHCKEWVDAGHSVTVITCFPNFPKGKVFDGYKNCLFQNENMGGISVIRVWTYIAENSGFTRRILDYMSFMVSSFLASFIVKKVDVVLGTSPQFFSVISAWASGIVKGVPFIFELRDLWPESIKAVGAIRHNVVIRLLEYLEMFLYRQAVIIVSVTESFRKILISRGIDGKKIKVVTNGVNFARFTKRKKNISLQKKLMLENCFVVGYIGTHGLAHCLETLLHAMKKLESHPEGKDIHLLMLGDGARKDYLQAEAVRMNLSNVLFEDSVGKELVPEYWSILDASIIHLKRIELFSTVIPSKLFECMGMGIPILLGVEGESAKIVRETGSGVLFEPENAQQLAAKLILLKSSPKLCMQLSKACLHASRQYDRNKLASNMLNLIDKAVSKKGL